MTSCCLTVSVADCSWKAASKFWCSLSAGTFCVSLQFFLIIFVLFLFSASSANYIFFLNKLTFTSISDHNNFVATSDNSNEYPTSSTFLNLKVNQEHKATHFKSHILLANTHFTIFLADWNCFLTGFNFGFLFLSFVPLTSAYNFWGALHSLGVQQFWLTPKNSWIFSIVKFSILGEVPN